MPIFSAIVALGKAPATSQLIWRLVDGLAPWHRVLWLVSIATELFTPTRIALVCDLVLVVWLAYCGLVTMSMYNEIEHEVIGVPGSKQVPSVVRQLLRITRTWCIVKWRSLTRKPLLHLGGNHEKRFRHYHRIEWRDTPNAAPCHEKSTHGHPTLAAERRGVQLEFTKLLNQKQYKVYDVSSSRRTLRLRGADKSAIAGFHGHFSPRDLMYESRNDEITADHALTLIDVDYYVDMHELATHMVPMCLYTFAPPTSSGHTPESSWNTRNDDDGNLVVKYSVSGGEVYEHNIWDYGDTSFVSFEKGGMLFTYAAERHRPHGDSTHLVIWLQPSTISVVGCPRFDAMFRKTHVVARAKVPASVRQQGDTVVIVEGGLEFRLRAALWQIILATCETSKTVSPSQLYTFLKNHKSDWVSGDVQYFSEWIAHRFKTVGLPTTLVYASVMEKPDGEYFSMRMKPTFEEMGPVPTNVPAATPTNDRCSDAAAVTTRVAQVHNSVAPPAVYDNWLKSYLAGIAELTNTPQGSLKPYTADEILGRTERKKTAAKILGAYETAGSSASSSTVNVKAFVKKEAYVKPGDERNISPTDDDHLSKLAPYAYRVKDVLCKLPQYMPGRTPKEIAKHIREIMLSGHRVWETDFSRYDGQQSRCMRSWETIFFAYFFEDGEAAELVFKEVFKVSASSGAGTYCPGGSLLSGSSLTTIMNTFKHMFIQYCTYRKSGLTHEEAMARCFAAYGDDGVLTGEQEIADNMAVVCDEIGMKNLKCVEGCTVERPYLTFVGRVFFDSGDEHAPSFQDPSRVWTKINLISRGPAAKERYLAKLACYLVTDGESPLLGGYCRAVIRLTKGGDNVLDVLSQSKENDAVIADLADAQVDRQWLLVESRARLSEAWPNHGFPEHARSAYATLLGVSLSDLDAADNAITRAMSLADLNGILSLPEPVLNPRFVYDGMALSYGMPVKYDNNKDTGRFTSKEHRSILKTARTVLGTKSPIPLPGPPNRERKVGGVRFASKSADASPPEAKTRGARLRAADGGVKNPPKRKEDCASSTAGSTSACTSESLAPTGSGAPLGKRSSKWVRTPKSATENASKTEAKSGEKAGRGPASGTSRA